MMNNYIKRSALLLGAAAMLSASAMAEEGTWRNVNYLLKNPAFIPGWSGAVSATDHGCAEVWCGAFDLYQVLPDMPAGEYTLTVNASYRYAGNAESQENMGNGANHNAYIYINDTKQVVMGLFEAEGVTPHNSMEEASASFAAGNYLNTVKYTHEGGDLKIGIANTGGLYDEWTIFDNFRLTGPNGDCTDKIVNADFSEGLYTESDANIWEMSNIDAAVKKPDVNKQGGVYRKTNASPYNFGQQVELEAGTYRFGVQSFLRYGGGNQTGGYWTVKGEPTWVEDESAYDRHVNGNETAENAAYIYVTDGWDVLEDGSAVKPTSAEWAKYGKEDAFYNEVAIKCLFDENLDVYPENEPLGTDPTAENYGWCDSGFEYQAAAVFVKNPDLYRNYVEFTLTGTTKVWLGLKKDKNAPIQYWNPFRDFTLEKLDAGAGVANVAADVENAPVEYFNLQGIRVADPANGIFIVKQGNKVTKQVIR